MLMIPGVKVTALCDIHIKRCREMIHTADETGKLLMVGQVCRFTPGFIKAKEIVDNTTPYLTLTLERSCENGHFADGFFGTGSEREIRPQINVNLNNHNVTTEHKALRAAVLEGKPLLMTGREDAKTVAVCRAVGEAGDSRKAVKVDYDF